MTISEEICAKIFFLFFVVSCQINNVYGRPGPNSIWSTTALGDVYVFDPAVAEVMSEIYVCRNNNTKHEELSFVILVSLCVGMSII